MKLYLKEDENKYVETKDFKFLSKLKVYIVWNIWVQVIGFLIVFFLSALFVY